MIDLTRNEEQLARTVKRCRERNIVIPTFEQLKNPELIPDQIKEELKKIDLWAVEPQNLFRITWKNEPQDSGGLFREIPNYMEIPQELTGIEARVIALVGKWFPTGAHKVGATFGCLVPPLVTGQFDPTTHKAVWPSTGNYCRGGAYDATLLACESIAILPEEMSQERFDWLKTVAGEIIATPGSESNVKEIYDKVWELRRERDDIFVFNQFSEFGNYLFHYDVTGAAMEEVLEKELGNDCYQGVCLTTGSAGTIACGDYMKQLYPASKIAAGEALQCPTLLLNGYGAHRIEGIGDKHVPWIHNTRNTDMVIAIDDNDSMALMRLFNEPAGRHYLTEEIGIPGEFISQLDLLGISSIANLLMCIKFAKYYELTSDDVILTVFTDSMEMYDSRLREARAKHGEYTRENAIRDFHLHLKGMKIDALMEMGYYDRKRIHHLKYFTWIEQQQFELDELNRQWYDYDEYWSSIQAITPEIDEQITKFNQAVGLLK
ncbi:MAG: Pyridoxal-5-phosphate-dependent protein subunit beta [Candidatus Thorarchaeota archaeon]|nr:MAG: Pyridoxal-5-phosphate-dependent protein subunit beta [Candidatus Thorarchaeota archaeon]